MNRVYKYITVTVLALCLIFVMIMPSFAAVVSQDITSSQMETILNVNNFSYLSGYFTGYNSSFEYATGTAGDNVPVFYRQNMIGASFGWTADQRNLFNVSFGWTRPTTSLTEQSLDLTPNTTYTLSCDLPSAPSASGRAGYLYVRNTSGSFQNGVNVVYSGHSVTVTTEADGKLYFGARNSLDGTTSINWESYWKQLEQGSVATNYMPYAPTVNLNFPLFLSGFKTLTFQFIVQGDALNSLVLDSMYSISDSIASPIEFEYVGTLSSDNISYPYSLYQITVDSDIDIFQVRFLPQAIINSNLNFRFGFVAISILADDSVMQGISAQISSINTKITQLISAIGDLQTALDGLVVQNGDVVTNLQEINNIANSIEENQELMLYLTENEELVVQNITQNNTSNTTKINQYIAIMQQYAENYPTVNNVENIIESGVPSAEAIALAVGPIQSLFDATWFIGILATVGAVALLSYVLFGKR